METNRVYNRIPYPTGTLVLHKRSRVNDPLTNQPKIIEGAEFSLINAAGAVVAKAVTDSEGKAEFKNVIIDDYLVRETVVPEGYYTPESDLRISAQTWMRTVDNNYYYEYGIVTNEPIFAGRLILEKLDSAGKPLPGIEFMLEKIGDSSFAPVKLRTDKDGSVEFNELPEGEYRLTETRTLNNLKPNGVIKVNGGNTFRITYPDQVWRLTNVMNKAIINDRVEFKLYKIGLKGVLDPAKALSEYTLFDGRAVNEDVTFSLREKDSGTSYPVTKEGDHWLVSDLPSGKTYVLSETAVAENSIYKRNPKAYEFKVDPSGKLLSTDDKPFKGKDIYFPNELKPLVGELNIVKKDQDGEPLAGAEFALYRLDEASNTYVPAVYDSETGTYQAGGSQTSQPTVLKTDEAGKLRFFKIAAGQYELRETMPPDGYVGKKRQVRFTIEETASQRVVSDPNYAFTDDYVIYVVNIEAVNYKINMDFIKIESIAKGVSETEADAILARETGAVKEKDGNFYNVYRTVAGCEFKLYEVADGKETLLKEGMVTDADGRLQELNDIAWHATKQYKFVETKVPDNTWILNPSPYTVNIRNAMLDYDFEGTLKIRFENNKRSARIIVSKYERLNSGRLTGAGFALYDCSKAELEADPDRVPSRTGTTGENGFLEFSGLGFGTYVVKEISVPASSEGTYVLNNTLYELKLTPQSSSGFVDVYNVLDNELFDLPVELRWSGKIPENQKVVLKLSYIDPSKPFMTEYEPIESVTVDADGNWEHLFKDLYAEAGAGRELRYKVEQETVDGYRLDTSEFTVKRGEDNKLYYITEGGTSAAVEEIEFGTEGSRVQGLSFLNYRQIDLLLRKTWDDNADAKAARPTQTTFTLWRNGERTDKQASIHEVNGTFEYVFRDLDEADAAGAAYTYSVLEDHVDYYYPTYSEVKEGGRTAGDEDVDQTIDVLNTLYPSVDLKAKKSLLYKTLEDQEFSFALYKSDSSGARLDRIPGTFSNNAAGEIVFADVVVPAELGAENAVYYRIEEESGPAYYTTDSRAFLAKVYMLAPSDNTSVSAVAEVEYYALNEEGGTVALNAVPLFENTYLASGSFTPLASKNLSGRDLTAQSFTFNLKQIEGKEAGLNNLVIQSKTNGSSAADDSPAELSAVSFDALKYDQSDIGKTYKYEISEAIPENTETGLSYDPTVYTAKVEISDGGLGELNVKVTYFKDDMAIEGIPLFVNVYEASGKCSFEAAKVLEGRELKADEFSFELKQIQGPDVSLNRQVLETVKNDAEGKIAFAELSYNEAAINKTYTYEIREVKPTVPETGMTYDETVYTVKVFVTDLGNGKLNAAVSYEIEGSAIDGTPTFENSYKAEGEAEIKAEKLLEGRDLKPNEFSFILKQIEGPDASLNGEQLETKASALDGSIKFTKLSYDQKSINKTYTYELSEVTPETPETGMTYDETVYTVKVFVTDLGNGKLNAAVSYEIEGNAVDGTPTFENSYKASGEAEIKAEKLLEGRDLKPDEFSFNLKQLEGPDASLNGTVTETKANALDGSIKFTKLSYDQTSINKTYTYELSEVTPETPETGMTYDETVYTVKVFVTDLGNGKLNAAVSYEIEGNAVDGTPAFENSYKASGRALIESSKKLVERPVKDGEFSFNLKQLEGPDASLNGTLLETKANDLGGSIKFTALNYDQKSINKTYTYELSEVMPETPETGMTYDETVYTVKVFVTDLGNGKLNAAVTYYRGQTSIDGAPVFDNAYKAEGSCVLELSKALQGRTLKENEFSFVLKQVEGPDSSKNQSDLEETVNALDGSFFFSELQFFEDSINKTYVYEVSEIKPETPENGMSYDETVYTAKIAVTDLGNGKLNAAVSWYEGETLLEEAPIFKNIYEASGDAKLEAEKILNGRNLKADEFVFVLKQIEGVDQSADESVLETVKNDAEGQIKFKALAFDQSSIDKTYTYELSELKPETPETGMSYDERVYTVKIAVTDLGNGKLDTAVTYLEGETVLDALPVFENTYEASGEAQLEAEKILNGRALKAEEFAFELKQIEGVDQSADQSVLETVGNDAEGQIKFKALAFDQSSIGKTYTYELRELKPETPESGMSYDETVYTVKIAVTDLGNGKLNAAVSWYEGETLLEEAPIFKNIYEASGDAKLEAEKILNGRALKAGEFVFELKQIEGADQSADESVLETVKNDAEGQIKFKALAFDQSSIGKTYTYELRELKPETPESGMSYDERVYTVKIAVTDLGNGKLDTAVAYLVGETVLDALPTFENTYKASGEAQLEAQKVLNGRGLKAEEFAYELKQIEGVDQSADQSVLETVRSDAEGQIKFKALVFDESSIGKTYTYELRELKPETPESGMSYDESIYTVKIAVTDRGNGELDAAVTYLKGETALDALPTFENTYEASGEAQLEAQTVLNGRALKAGEFAFELKQIEGADQSVLETVRNDAEGQIKFKTLVFDESSIGRIYTYELRELKPEKPENGMSYDERVYTVKIAVTDRGNGELDAAVTYLEGETALDALPIFENAYEASGEAQIKAQKVLNGRDLKALEFVFELKQIEGADQSVLETVRNDAEGKIKFKALTFDESSIGKTYTYELRELKPETPETGMSYDERVYTVKIAVTDRGNGKLNAAVTYLDDETPLESSPQFENRYEARGSALIEAEKVLDGRELKADEFRFALKQLSGPDSSLNHTVIETAGLTAEGQIRFSELSFDEQDINKLYRYELYEIKADKAEDGMSYDQTVYTLEIRITDLGNGELEALLTYSGGALSEDGLPLFGNRYEAEGKVFFKGLSDLIGRKIKDGEFGFELKQIEGPDPAENGQILKQIKNKEDGGLSFGELVFDQHSINKVYTYEIRQSLPETPENGMSYDESVYTVKLEIKDEGNGRLSVQVSYLKDGKDYTGAIVFENVYKAEGRLEIQAQKTLKGTELKDAAFRFELRQIAGPDKSFDGQVLSTAVNDAEGLIAFDALIFDQNMTSQRYVYELRELVPEEKAKGMTYDESVYTIYVVPEDAGNGEIEFKVSCLRDGKTEVDKILFSNVFEAPKVPETGEAAGRMTFALISLMAAFAFAALRFGRRKEEED